MLNNKLKSLNEKFPLSSEWSTPELFHEECHLGSLHLKLVGISTEDNLGNIATGSAAELEDFPLERAYFELIERTSIVEAEKKNSFGNVSMINTKI